MFGIMEGKFKNNANSINIHTIPLPALDYRNETQRKMFRDFKSFMVIRDPIQRVFSAYKSKLVPLNGKPSPMFFRLASEIVHFYRSKSRKQNQKFPSVHEFVQFITDTNKKHIQAPHHEMRHWLPQTELCYPCDINYNFILNISKVEKESEFLLNLTEIPNSMRYPKQISNIGNSTKASKHPPTFMNLDDRDYKALCRYYKTDYEILGFEYPPECS